MSLDGKSVVALLPMKANSERVKGKNFRQFAGKPLFQWVLDVLWSAPLVDRVVINTDAREMLASHGLVEDDRVMIRDRKAELCGDDISMNLVLKDDIDHVAADVYVMTHTTNPLLECKTLERAVYRYTEAVSNGQADSLFSVNKVQTRFYREDGSAVNHDPQHLIRTQDLEPWFEENSCLYIFSRASFSNTNARIGVNPIIYETPKRESVDIDDVDDWAMAEALALYQGSENQPNG